MPKRTIPPDPILFETAQKLLREAGYDEKDMEIFIKLVYGELTPYDYKHFIAKTCHILREKGLIGWRKLSDLFDMPVSTLYKWYTEWLELEGLKPPEEKEKEQKTKTKTKKETKEETEEKEEKTTIMDATTAREIDRTFRQVAKKKVTQIFREDIEVAFEIYNIAKSFEHYFKLEGKSLQQGVREAIEFYFKYKDEVPKLKQKYNIAKAVAGSLIAQSIPYLVHEQKLKLFVEALTNLAVVGQLDEQKYNELVKVFFPELRGEVEENE